MADYQLTAPEEPCTVIRNLDGACIPPAPGNRDYDEYLQWKADGGVPDPYKKPFHVEPFDTGETIAQRLNVRE